jgi:hypothetical protein
MCDTGDDLRRRHVITSTRICLAAPVGGSGKGEMRVVVGVFKNGYPQPLKRCCVSRHGI